MEKSYKEYLNQITTFIFDVDGVFTDGSLLIDNDGNLLRTMNVKDGYAVKIALNMGYKVCIITGGRNEAVKKRLSDLGVSDIYMNAHDKIIALEDFLNTQKISLDQCLYMGDDLPDIPVMRKVALATCPQDAVPEVKAASKYISHINGGKGCVRDVVEQVLKVHGKWYRNEERQTTSE